uniref:Uncharacterized protein n=1 Tax=Romanomermis culicivorax TaxID=13658 RepID=A0A915KWU7_ROMCU
MWRVFQEALVQVMHEEFQKTDALTAREKTLAEDGWAVIADFIITEMEVGFYGASARGLGSRSGGRNCFMKRKSPESNYRDDS